MSRNSIVAYLRHYAFKHREDHDYLPQNTEELKNWFPHEWVIEAMTPFLEDIDRG